LGDGAKAIELYEQVLREAPDHAVAEATLKFFAGNPADHNRGAASH